MYSTNKYLITIASLIVLTLINLLFVSGVSIDENVSIGPSKLFLLKGDFSEDEEACVDVAIPEWGYEEGSDQFCLNPTTGQLCGIQRKCYEENGICQAETCWKGYIVITPPF